MLAKGETMRALCPLERTLLRTERPWLIAGCPLHCGVFGAFNEGNNLAKFRVMLSRRFVGFRVYVQLLF